MPSNLEAALWYRERGWSVIPVSPSRKKTVLKSWVDYQERLPTEDEIRTWWTERPYAGIAIVTGKVSNLVVLDVDTDKGADPHRVFRDFPTPLVVQSPSGGFHFYYTYPDGSERIANSATKLGYDIRADGGHIHAPPTLHPSGRRYAWYKKSDPSREPAPLVEGVLELAQRKKDGSRANQQEPWISELLQGVDEGGRNDACARLAGYYLSRKMAPDVVLENLKLWDRNNTPPLGDDVLEATVRSIQHTRQRAESRDTRTPPAVALEDEEGDLLRLVSMHQYMAEYGDHDVSWCVDGWLPNETIAMIVSPPGTYKTWTLLDLAVSVATGTPFLGTANVLTPGPVLIFQQEDFHGQIAQRIGVIMAGRFDMGWMGDDPKEGEFTLVLPPSPPVYFHPDRELRFGDPDTMDMLEARIDALNPALVIIDPLYTAANMDNYMADAINDMMRLKTLRDRYHCSFLIAHHTSKRKGEKGDSTSREDAWGSQYLNAFLETGWQVRPRTQSSALIRRHFKVSKDAEENVLHFTIDTTRTPGTYLTEITNVDETDSFEAKIAHLIDIYGAQTLTDRKSVV